MNFAAGNDDLNEVKELVAKGKTPNAFGELGKTPLHYAPEQEHLELVQFLLQMGATVNAHDKAQIANTSLREVAGQCSYELAQLLPDPSLLGWLNLTALDVASQRKRPEGLKVYQLLLEGADRK